MHDPDVVAFTVRRPWPQRSTTHDATPRRPARWRFGLSPFWTLAGRGYWWPSLVTVWHREPGGRDSGEVCRHYDRDTHRVLHGWRWHVHHWRLQIHPLQHLRRWALTRCAWCGGRSVKGDPVNVSHSWDGPRGRWWQGEPGLYHHDCSSISTAHHTCLCHSPLHEHELAGYTYGRCVKCSKFRAWRTTPAQLDRQRLLAAIPAGGRDAAMYAQVCELAKADRATAPKETP